MAAGEFVLASRGEVGLAAELRRIEMRAPTRLSLRALGLGAEGRPDEGLALIEGWLRPAEGRSLGMMARAQLLAMLGRWPEVAAVCGEIRKRAQRIGWTAGPAMADRQDAERLLASGNPEAAEPLARASAEQFAAIGAQWESAVSWLSSAEASLALGQAGGAAAALAAAEPALRSAGALRELERLDRLSGRAAR
jgi:hypothetical protein